MSGRALDRVRSRSMLDKPGKLRVFRKSRSLIALAIAAGMGLGVVGPSSAQFFNFGGNQQRPQPQRGGGGYGGGWGGGGGGRVGDGKFLAPPPAPPPPLLKARPSPPPPPA